MFTIPTETPSFLTNTSTENAHIFNFEDDQPFMPKKAALPGDFFPQFKLPEENGGSYNFSFEPENKLEVAQTPGPHTEECPKVNLDKVQPLSSFVDKKEQPAVELAKEVEDSQPAPRRSRKRKTTDFAYLLERKSFRMMRKYYKEKFEFEIEDPEYKKKLPKMSTDEINKLVSEFMNNELGTILICLLTQNDYARIRDALKTIIFCDRYQKKENISAGLSFVPLRNVLHKYNTRNLIDFLSDASYSFLYTHFYLKEGKKAALEQSDNDADKLLARMRHLMKEASNYLPTEINKIFEEIHASIF